MDGTSFDQPRRALLVATAAAENTGMTWLDAEHTTVGDRWGGVPSRVRMVTATLRLPTRGRSVSIRALSPRGQPGEAVPVTTQGDWATVRLGGDGASLWYEVLWE